MKVKNIVQLAQKIIPVCLAVLTLALGWIGVGQNAILAANAFGLNPSLTVAESNPVDEIEDVFGPGTADRVEGKAKEGIGTIQRNVGKLSGQVEGTAKQVQGRAEQNFGRVKNKIDRNINSAQRRSENAASELDNASDNLVDAVKDMFGQE